MKRAILIATILAAFASGSVFAQAPTLVTWSDNFDSATLGAVPGNMAGWTGGGPDGFTVVSDGGNQVVADNVGTYNGSWSWAWTTSDLGLAAYDVQILHFSARKVSYSGGGAGLWKSILQVVDAGGNPIGGWRITGAGYWNAVVDAGYTLLHEKAGWAPAWPDDAYHNFDMQWTVSTGELVWYVDGVEWDRWTSARAGVKIAHVQFDNDSGNSDLVYYDDIRVGTNVVPEPSSLVAFATFGIGVFGLMRRRRA